MHLAAESQVDRSITDPAPSCDQRHRHPDPARCRRNSTRAERPRSRCLPFPTSRPTRSTGPAPDAFSPRIAATTALALLGLQGRLGPPRPRPGTRPTAAGAVRTARIITAPALPEKLIPLMILKCPGGQTPPVYGDGLNERDGSTSRITPPDSWRCWSGGGSGRPTYSAGGGCATTSPW